MKVRVGSRYRPSWFERRSSDGTYQWFNAEMQDHELKLQRALCPPKGPSLAQRGQYWIGVALSVLAAVIILNIP